MSLRQRAELSSREFPALGRILVSFCCHRSSEAKLPDGSLRLFEIKLDGYRAVVLKSDRDGNLYSRRYKSFNHRYPHIVEALSDLPDGTVVDGEVVALDETGRPNFNLLQNFRSEASRIITSSSTFWSAKIVIPPACR